MVRRLGPMLLLAFLCGLPYLPILIAGQAMGPHDQVRAWAGVTGLKTTPWDVLQMDGVLQSSVWRDLVLSSWRSGHVPFWNPYVLMGTPLLANSQSGVLYPPHIVLGLLGVGWQVAGVLLAWFHAAVAGLGASALTRRLGGSALGGMAAGVAFGLSPFLLSWAALSSVPTTVAWIPWLLAGVVTVARDGYRRLWAVAIPTGLMILGGHLQFAAYGVMAALVVAAAMVVRDRCPRPALATMLGLALGAMLAAPQFLPVLQFGQNSHRRTVATSEGATAYMGAALKPYELAGLAAPYALGDPREEGPKLAERPDRFGSTYWPSYAKPGGNYAEAALSLGPLAFLIALCAPWRRRKTWTPLAVGGVGLLLATGPLSLLLYYLVPGWASTGSPGRASVLVVLAGTVLVGMGATRLEKAPPAPKLIALGGLGGIAALAALILTGQGSAPEAVRPFAMIGLMSSAYWLVVGAVLASLFVVAFSRPAWRGYARIALPFALALAAIPTFSLVTRGTPKEWTQASIPKKDRVGEFPGGWDLLVTPDVASLPNVMAHVRQPTVTGYDSLIDAETKRLLDDANGQDSAVAANGNLMTLKPTADRAKLAALGVANVTQQFPAAGQVSTTYVGGHVATLNGQPIALTRPTDSQIEVEVTQPGDLLVRERAIAGWRATQKGGPVDLADGPWLRVANAQPGTYLFTYVPPRYPLGLVLATLAALVLAATANFRRRPVTSSS